jgi:hypothetical protein
MYHVSYRDLGLMDRGVGRRPSVWHTPTPYLLFLGLVFPRRASSPWRCSCSFASTASPPRRRGAAATSKRRLCACPCRSTSRSPWSSSSSWPGTPRRPSSPPPPRRRTTAPCRRVVPATTIRAPARGQFRREAFSCFVYSPAAVVGRESSRRPEMKRCCKYWSAYSSYNCVGFFILVTARMTYIVLYSPHRYIVVLLPLPWHSILLDLDSGMPEAAPGASAHNFYTRREESLRAVAFRCGGRES